LGARHFFQQGLSGRGKGLRALGSLTAAGLICAGLGAIPAAAAIPAPQPTGEDVTIGDAALAETLKRDIASHDYTRALKDLDARPDIENGEDGFRLRIKLLRASRQEDKALALLERHLSKHPHDGFARFEVAEINNRYGAGRTAALNYRLALAGDLGDSQAALARSRLEAILRPQKWRFWMGASVSPDSNVNSTTDDTHLALYGLPFVVYNGPENITGTVYSAHAGADKLTLLGPELGLRTTITGTWSDGPDLPFDSRSLSLQAGPEWTIGPMTHMSLSGRAIVQWLGKTEALTGQGLALHADTYGSNTLWTGQVSGDRLDIHYNRIGEAWNTRLQVKRVHFLGTSALWSLDAAIGRRGAAFNADEFSEGQLKLGRLFQTPFSSLVYLEANQRLRVYDEDPMAVGRHRKDYLSQFTARLSKRDLLLFGAVPYLAVVARHNDSNVSVYSSNHTRLDFGLTRDF